MVDSLFGGGFSIDAKFQPLAADFDNDGVEDLAVVTIGRNPLQNSNSAGFKVIDPYDSYFGFGDTKITARFADMGDGTAHCVLMIHSWQSAKPKAKFVIVNLPFEKLSLGAAPYKKKTVVGLSAREMGGLNAMVFWDGKKYRWEPTEFSSDFDQLQTMKSDTTAK